MREAQVERVSRWVTQHRLLVGLLWLAINDGVHVDTAAYAANPQIARQYGGAMSNPGILVINLPHGQTVNSAGVSARLHAFDAQVAKASPGLREVSYASTGSRTLVGSGGKSTIVLVYPPRAGADVPASVLNQLAAAARAAVPGATVHSTGLAALTAGNASAANASVLTELLIGALGALLVLAWVFGSVLALLPLIMALVSVLTMQLFVCALTYVVPSSTPINPAVQFIVALLGLGLSIDYSLLIVNRWREERKAGRPNAEAVQAAMHRAGHAVLVSGITASLGLFALIVVPVSLVRGIGISGLFIPSTATLVALTLLPVVLSKMGARLDWPRRRSAGAVSRLWTWWAHRVIRNRVAAAVLGLGILGALAGVATTINISQPTGAALASNGPYASGLRALHADGFPSGTLTTVPVWIPAAAPAAA